MMSILKKDRFGLKPGFFRISNPNLKDGVIVNVVENTVVYLSRPSGRGLRGNPTNMSFNPFLEKIQ